MCLSDVHVNCQPDPIVNKSNFFFTPHSLLMKTLLIQRLLFRKKLTMKKFSAKIN